MKQVPPRVHVIPATGCDKALILRRGPSDHVASLLWDRATNEFETGQWLKGRIYEHRADLSPDGRHMIYFAGTGKRWWTAISRAPWLRAVAFYSTDNTWHGGGAFDEKGHVWFNGSEAPQVLADGLKPANVRAYPHATDGFHMGDMFPAMMQQRGWTKASGSGYGAVLVKELVGGWQLELTFETGSKNRSMISHRYALAHPARSIVTHKEDWEWAEPHGDALQFAANGALHEARLMPDGALENQILIHDFTDMVFEAREAPYRGVSDR